MAGLTFDSLSGAAVEFQQQAAVRPAPAAVAAALGVHSKTLFVDVEHVVDICRVAIVIPVDVILTSDSTDSKNEEHKMLCLV